MNKIIDKQDRTKLIEGRDYGLGFAFCKKTKEGYETIQPISPCKDYLNDVIYSEHTNNKISNYGLTTEKLNIFNNEYAYLVIKVCKQNCKELYEYNNYEQDVNNLNKNYKNIQGYINHFEKLLNITGLKTKIVKTNLLNTYLIKFNKKWIESTYAISLITFLIRLAINLNNNNYDEFIDKGNHDINNAYYMSDIKDILNYLINLGHLPKQNLNTLINVHNYGIINWWNEQN